ncbi:unnamed protein product [Mucor hiemalis]
MLRSLILTRQLYSTIPFDKKPFPFSRFEPCCPNEEVKKGENGFVPCQSHPMPVVLGKKIELNDDMTRPSSLRHITPCIGLDALEWTRSKVEAIPGITQTIMNTQSDWIKSHRHLTTPQDDRLVLSTVSERPPIVKDKPDIMLFPEFKIIPSVDASHIEPNSTLYSILDQIWKNNNAPLKQLNELQDIQADTVVLVCTHARRDLRCGKLGPLIVDEFNRIIREKGLTEKVEVWGTSHFGGHKFAGNLIIHQRGLGGHMYGNVRQCHVPDIFDRHILHGKVIKEIWRGQVTPPTL